MLAYWQDTLSLTAIPGLLALTGFIGLVLAAAIHDLVSFRIPNKISLGILALWPVYALTIGVQDPVGHIVFGFLSFLIGFMLFALKAWGGGDAKIFAAIALWAGAEMMLEYVMITAIAGGFFALLMMGGLLRPLAFFLAGRGIVASADLMTARHMPYGMALAVGGIYVATDLISNHLMIGA